MIDGAFLDVYLTLHRFVLELLVSQARPAQP